MAKIALLLIIATIALVLEVQAQKNECPLSSQATTCSPKCVSDNDCLSSGKRCCPNICNTKSCVFPKSGNTGGGDKYNKGSSATGSYCGNTKCAPGEVCKMDKSKRQTCGRP
ncbi:waprin-like protein [Culicoides brevitarsis]|uniref:waprin-like protein n=1 Tax=Culicoides brevitarsis TaxID=469753 RepID=UPI00307B2295